MGTSGNVRKNPIGEFGNCRESLIGEFGRFGELKGKFERGFWGFSEIVGRADLIHTASPPHPPQPAQRLHREV